MKVISHNDEDKDPPDSRAILYDAIYIGLGDIGKIKTEQGATASISRAELWKAGHKRMIGEYINKDATDLASKIDELSNQESQSVEIMSHGRDDILASVLGKEHPVRVRIGGKFSTIKSFFNDDRRGERRSVARIKDVEAIVQERLSQQQELWQQQHKLWSQQQQAHQSEMNSMQRIEERMHMFIAGTVTVMSTTISVALALETFQDISQS